ncbi:hypothetical protein AK812_SmicGene39612 [Symbiodinium microadriaticum]|uniref:Uncharacterized protein n=1 Tax=Symbiodinium microadriaticum TaxID=2951 RepID=A0A1Q9CAU0_SYMMI|nr:hypothetical protein AK812_SmicGene39612 [Symbiodinium microadriaticum]
MLEFMIQLKSSKLIEGSRIAREQAFCAFSQPGADDLMHAPTRSNRAADAQWSSGNIITVSAVITTLALIIILAVIIINNNKNNSNDNISINHLVSCDIPAMIWLWFLTYPLCDDA